MAPRDDVNFFKKLEAEKRALDDIWSYSTDHRTIQFWNKTDEWIELTGSFSSQFGPSSINCVTKICLWPRKSYTWRFMGKKILVITSFKKGVDKNVSNY